MELLKSYERGRTKSDEKNKTSIGLENATLRHFLIGNEEREEKQKQEETTALITGRRKSNSLKTEEDKLEYFGEILKILVDEVKELREDIKKNNVERLELEKNGEKKTKN